METVARARSHSHAVLDRKHRGPRVAGDAASTALLRLVRALSALANRSAGLDRDSELQTRLRVARLRGFPPAFLLARTQRASVRATGICRRSVLRSDPGHL